MSMILKFTMSMRCAITKENFWVVLKGAGLLQAITLKYL
jgi:hypothetical protein